MEINPCFFCNDKNKARREVDNAQQILMTLNNLKQTAKRQIENLPERNEYNPLLYRGICHKVINTMCGYCPHSIMEEGRLRNIEQKIEEDIDILITVLISLKKGEDKKDIEVYGHIKYTLQRCLSGHYPNLAYVINNKV